MSQTLVRQELAKVQSPLIELREWRVALAHQTEKMRLQKDQLQAHRLGGHGAHGTFGLPKKKTIPGAKPLGAADPRSADPKPSREGQ